MKTIRSIVRLRTGCVFIIVIGGMGLIFQLRLFWGEAWNVTRKSAANTVPTDPDRLYKHGITGHMELENDSREFEQDYIFQKGRRFRGISVRANSTAQQYKVTCQYLNTTRGRVQVCSDGYMNGTADAETSSSPNSIAKTTRNGSVKKSDPTTKLHNIPSTAKANLDGILSYTRWTAYIDHHDYRYIINPMATTCTADGGQRDIHVDLLVLVTSHPDHEERRDVIRDTWGTVSMPMGKLKPNQPVVKVRFILGVSSLVEGGKSRSGTEVLGADLQKEIGRHGDIVVEEFVDSYLNLTIKTVMGLKWASRFCPSATFVMKTDDDMIINMPLLLTHLLHQAHPRHALITGRIGRNFPALREKWQKFYVPEDVYPGKTYPDYCVGLGYVMSIDVVHQLYLQSFSTPLFPWEDVYVGIMMKKLGVTGRNIANFYYTKGGSIFIGETELMARNTKSILKTLQSYYILDGLTPKQTRILWKMWQSGRV